MEDNKEIKELEKLEHVIKMESRNKKLVVTIKHVNDDQKDQIIEIENGQNINSLNFVFN